MTAGYSQRQLIGWLWSGYLRTQVLVIVLALVFMAAEGGALGLLSLSIKPMFDDVFVAGNRNAVAGIALAIFALFIGRAFAGFMQRVLMARVGRNVSAGLQKDLVRHMILLDSGFFRENAPGVLIERVRGDTQAASGIWASTFSAMGRDLVAMISLLAVAISIDWLWTLIAVAGAPLLIAPLLILQRVVRSTTRTGRAAAARISTRLDEIFHGIDTIKLNGTEAREAQRFGREVRRFVQADLRAQAGQAAIPALMDIVAGIGFLGVLWYGGLQIIDGQKTVGEFMSFFTAIALVFEPMRRLGGISGAWQVALASIERLYAVFQESPKIKSPAQPRQLISRPQEADVAFEGVSFSYGGKPVLRDVSFVAKAGKTTALVGASGAGKSTVFNILTRLVDPQSGVVSIGGQSIAELDLNALRALISVVTQDTQMFDETVRDNILFGHTADRAELDRVLEAAHVADFLPNLEHGLNSPAGPRGSALSGGQRQRIAIARALFRDTPFLLLDEATSALDAQSEAVVQEALVRLSSGRTTLVVAHRLSTIRGADKIIVLDKGRVVDEGRHEELVARGGLYADLCRLQFAPE